MATIKKSILFNVINNFTPNKQSIIANLHKVRNWNRMLRKMQFLKIFVLQSNKSALFQYIIIIIIKVVYQNDFIVAMFQRPPSPFLPLPIFPKTNNHIHPPFLWSYDYQKLQMYLNKILGFNIIFPTVTKGMLCIIFPFITLYGK